MVDMYRKSNKISINKLFDFFQDDLELEYLNKLFNSNFKVEDPQKAYNEIDINLRLHEIDEKIEKISEFIKNSKHGNNTYLMDLAVERRKKDELLTYKYNKM
jgi:hypothetical protein